MRTGHNRSLGTTAGTVCVWVCVCVCVCVCGGGGIGYWFPIIVVALEQCCNKEVVC